MKKIEESTEQSVVEAERIEAREPSELRDKAVTLFVELRYGAPHLAALPRALDELPDSVELALVELWLDGERVKGITVEGTRAELAGFGQCLGVKWEEVLTLPTLGL